MGRAWANVGGGWFLAGLYLYQSSVRQKRTVPGCLGARYGRHYRRRPDGLGDVEFAPEAPSRCHDQPA